MKSIISITLITFLFNACSTTKPQKPNSYSIKEQREFAKKYKYTNPEKSIYWYEKLALENDIESIDEYAYANLYMINPIIIQDVKKAVKLYEKLAKQNHESSLMRLANIYEYGYFKNEVPIDKQKALEYYKQASNMNYTPAQKKLVKIYLCKECNDNRYNKYEGIKLLEILSSKNDIESIDLLKKINSKETEEAIEEPIQRTKIEESAK